MAASPTPRSERSRKLLALALLLIIPLLNGVMALEDENTGRGDMNPQTNEAPGTDDPQIQVLPTVNFYEPTEKPTPTATLEDGHDDATAAPDVAANEETVKTDTTLKPETPPPVPPRGDNPNDKPKPQEDVVCVSKEAVEGKNAVSLKLRESSHCQTTQMTIENVLEELCGEDCKLEIYQEDNSDEVLVSGKYVEADVTGMANKFNNDNIKDKTYIEEAVPRWGKRSKLVLVSVLLAGLVLASLLVAGYCLKTHRKTSKGVRLAESFQVDEENQANTLVSVAPLPQEPADKPTVNGESSPEHGTNSTPTTNGHSAAQTQVADTEM
ncbi:hematopoietic progenitor cell antigen CD34 [Cololabis saira]|uniref:hematopoietic progenitor cell antigen CD34 n=1 Tax=Cololabis saira TaxID=129043 RepID=UPI002AD4CDF8|nr:hematopoietic progenitor cell antigen CD34 [Cololabis saira]